MYLELLIKKFYNLTNQPRDASGQPINYLLRSKNCKNSYLFEACNFPVKEKNVYFCVKTF